MKKYLFICGVPRSGTTALSRLIGLHPQIVMGTERYKYLYRGENTLSIDLFTKDRFFDIKEEETNLLLDNEGRKSYYENAFKKFDNAIYVGDKTPGIYNWYNKILEEFKQVKFIFILRDIHQVASSWNVRALNSENSKWKKEMDYKQAVIEWNLALGKTKEALGKGVDLVIVNYNNFFKNQQNGVEIIPNKLESLLEFLEIDNHPKFQKIYIESCKKFDELKNKELTIFEGQNEHINNNANFELYNEILKLAI
jgi:hypothetical protein